MACVCQGCGNKYKVDLIVSDKLWRVIKPVYKRQEAGFLCGSCIMERIEVFNNYGALIVNVEDVTIPTRKTFLTKMREVK